PDALELTLDHALLRHRVTRDALVACLGRIGPGRRGVSRLRALLDARPDGAARMESPLELELHRLLERERIAGWLPNHRLRLADGRSVRLDVAFVEATLAVEADGGYRWHAS